jgi:hypothetical protein
VRCAPEFAADCLPQISPGGRRLQRPSKTLKAIA